MKAFLTATRTAVDGHAMKELQRRIFSVSVTQAGGPSLKEYLDQDLDSAFSSGKTSELKTRLTEIKHFSSKNPRSMEVGVIYETMLSKAGEQFKDSHGTGAPARIMKHPLTQIIHSTIKEAVTSKNWIPTKKKSYQTLLKLSPDPEAAEEWLRLQRANCTMPVDRNDFKAVIQAWARSGRPDAAEKVERLIMELRTQYEATGHKEISMKPTEAAYIGWITCLSNMTDKITGATKAAQVLDDILQRAEKDSFHPRIHIYNAVMKAWAKAGQPQNAETMLRDLCEKAFDPGSCMPDQISFSIVIDAWAKSGIPEAPDRAEDLLVLLQQFSGFCFNPTTRPNAIVISAVMNCWAKSTRAEAADKAEALLRLMIRDYRAGKPEMRPTVISFNTCMNAWARSGQASSPEQVESLFQDLVDFGLQPDPVSYMARISAWERARRRDGIECAERALRAFEEMTESGLFPSALHYERVLLTLSRCSDGHRAQALLDHMIQNSEPTQFSYDCVLSAWARHCSVEGASQCERILSFMEEKNIVAYNTVIGAWAKSKSLEALEKAEDLLGRILDSKLKPDSYTLSPIFRLLADSNLTIEEKRHKSESLLKIANEYGVTLIDESSIAKSMAFS